MDYRVKTKKITIKRNRSFDLSLDNIPPPIERTPPKYNNSFVRKIMSLVSTNMINEKIFDNYVIKVDKDEKPQPLNEDDLIFDLNL